MRKLIPFNYFLYFHITVIISITPKNNFTKERGIYEHAWIYFIHDYTCLCMFMNIYTYLYIIMHKKLLNTININIIVNVHRYDKNIEKYIYNIV